ncbi:MAG: NAD-dependent epimerase/dehydratase family protein [Acutalibacteraceae bacterium]
MCLKHIFVTGAMGYLGNTIISKLAAQGKHCGLALPNDNTISYTPNVEIVHGDVRDKDSLTSFSLIIPIQS